MERAWGAQVWTELARGRREVAQAPQASRMVGRGQGLDSVLGEGWQESTGMLAVPLDACGQVLSPPGLPCPG